MRRPESAACIVAAAEPADDSAVELELEDFASQITF